MIGDIFLEQCSTNMNIKCFDTSSILPQHADYAYRYPQGWRVKPNMDDRRVEKAITRYESDSSWIPIKDVVSDKNGRIEFSVLRTHNLTSDQVPITFTLKRAEMP
jgi:hypothetical protein